MLNTVTAPAGTNFSNQLLTNVGTLENKGFEFSINAHAVSTQDWNWNIGYNISYNKNKITKMTFNDDPNYAGVIHGGIDGGTGYNALIHRVGEAFNSFYVFEQIYGPDGKPIEGAYVDQNGDNQINDADLISASKSCSRCVHGTDPHNFLIRTGIFHLLCAAASVTMFTIMCSPTVRHTKVPICMTRPDS